MQMMRLTAILGATLLLASCLMPGKFTSTLDIKRDRSFTFTYVGEVYLIDEPDSGMSGMSSMTSDTPDADGNDENGQDGEEEKEKVDPAAAAAAKAKLEEKRRMVADALSKEQGYRSVSYVGEGKYQVDYAISGKLDRSFAFPFNSDAEAMIPWLMIEARKDGTARMSAPAFGDSISGMPNIPTMGGAGPNDKREGRFTLTTDAEIVMHNVEAGATPGAVKTLAWRVSPTSKTVPTAVVRFAK